MSETLHFAGSAFFCGPYCTDPVLSRPSDREFIAVDGSIATRAWFASNFIYENEKVTRISNVLLHRLAQAYASKCHTQPHAFYLDTSIPLDTSAWHKPANRQHAKTYKGCTSPHHKNSTKNSPFSRRRCDSCFRMEMCVHQATWPLVQSLAKRMNRWFAEQVVNGVKGHARRRHMINLVGSPGHDLQLVGIKLPVAVLPWLSPLAQTIHKIKRSTHKNTLLKMIPQLLATGWVVIDDIKKNTNLCCGPAIFRKSNVFYLPELANLVREIATHLPDFELVCPYHPLAINNQTWSQLKAVGKGRVYGWRAWDKCTRFEVICAIGARLGCTLRNVGPKHFCATNNRKEREALEAEAGNPWQKLTNIDALIEILVDVHILKRSDDGRLFVAYS